MKIAYGSEVDVPGTRINLISPVQTVHEDSCLSFLYHIGLLDHIVHPAYIVVYWATIPSPSEIFAGHQIWKSEVADSKQVNGVNSFGNVKCLGLSLCTS